MKFGMGTLPNFLRTSSNMKLSVIESWLKKNKISYQLYNPNYDLEVSPGSFKNKINFGFYHISKGFNSDISDINNSIFFCEENIETTCTKIILKNAQLVQYKLLSDFYIEPSHEIHATAIIHSEALIGKNVNVGPYSVIGKCEIADNVNIQSHVVIYDKTKIESGVFIDSNSNIGPAGLVWVWDEEGNRVNQPQTGGVHIYKNCHIGTDITIVRGSFSEDTIVGEGTVMAHGTKIGHSSIIGRFVHMANNVSIAGNTTLGDRSFFGSGAVVPPNIRIPKNTIVGAGAVVNKNFNEEHLTLVGVPAKILYTENYKIKSNGTPLPFK